MGKIIQEMIEKGLISLKTRELLDRVPVEVASSKGYEMDWIGLPDWFRGDKN